MSNKIVNSFFDEDTGVSRVTMQNKYGKFIGFAQCHPDDMKNFSMYAGSRYAETRAAMDFAKFRLKQEKIKLQTIQNLITDISRSAKCDYELECITEHTGRRSNLLRQIKLKLRDYSQSVEDWSNLYDFLKTSVKKQDEERQRILSRTRKEK